ncbi:MAG: acyltransferase [Bacteroidaceae bacterium]|nr:acyltransferase [Bacteroidaceae bacterium]
MIQVFRALSIIAVVMIHTTPSGEWQVFCRPFINFSVATFLFLSGYLTKIENDNWYAFCKKRIIRVIIPYIIWTTVYTLPQILSGGSILLLAKNLITAKSAAIMYYILVYIQFVLLTPLLGNLAKSKYRHLGWFITPIYTLIFKYYVLFTGCENVYVSQFWYTPCFVWFTYYYLGLLLGNKIINSKYSLKTLVLLYIASIALEMVEGYGWFLLGSVNCGSSLKLSSALASSIFILIVYNVLNKHINIKSKFLSSLGDYSFGIYLCHIMIMMVLTRIYYYTIIPYPLTSVIVILISWVFCYIGNRVLGNRISGWIGFK